MNAFLDTSSLLKLYYKEAGSAALRKQLDLESDTLVVSELAWVEMHSAFQMKVRQGVLTQASATTRLRLFARNWRNFSQVPLTTQLLTEAANLIRKHRGIGLRTLDAIQLACALTAGPLDAFFTHDKNLRDAATAEGLPVR